MNLSRYPLRAMFLLSALASAANMAAAQSVTLYGRVDLGIQYSNKTGASDNHAAELYNGGVRPSIWGLKGVEPLGGDLSAFFNLEAHLFADTGASAREGQSFRRQANVGLRGPWGTVTLGRQYSPALLAHIGTEPRAFREQFSGLYPYALNQNGNNPTNDVGVFVGNAISYANALGPVNLNVAYSFGEQTIGLRAGQAIAIGATYGGPVTLSLSYQKINDITSTSDGTRHIGLGAAFPLGAFTIKALYMGAQQQVAGLKISKVDTLSAGVDLAWGGAHTATLAVYRNKDKENPSDKTTTLVLSDDYALSKRSTLYAQLAYADADAGATARTTIISGGSFPDARTVAFGVGISHNF